jgi:hypothetical protein
MNRSAAFRITEKFAVMVTRKTTVISCLSTGLNHVAGCPEWARDDIDQWADQIATNPQKIINEWKSKI